jgi:hypothetical protein
MSRLSRPALAVLALAAAALTTGAALAQQAPLQPVDFAANKINIRHGEGMGKSTCSVFSGVKEYTWRSGAINENSREFRDIFLDAANANSVPTAGTSGSLFQSQNDRRQADYLVGSVVTKIYFEGCNNRLEGTWKGETNVTVVRRQDI